MKDLNYFPLNVESNIYGMTTLEFEDRPSKVLVATLDCQIYCINYDNFRPHTREVEFTYIPSGAKIISIGALKRDPNDFAIGITHSLAPHMQKSSTRQSSNREVGDYGRLTTYYLNIYASGSVSAQFDLDYVAQGCQTIRLKYVPYHLYFTELITIDQGTMTEKRKPYWLLSGGDNCIHAFCEERPYQSFSEVPIEKCFPELVNLPSIALWIDVANFTGCCSGRHERVVALGLEDGSVKVYHSAVSSFTNKFELVRVSSFDDYTTIIPSVRLFKIKSTSKNSNLRNVLKADGILLETEDDKLEQLNLLVVSSTNSSLVFEDVLNRGLEQRFELPESQRLDCSVTSAICDINFDGQNELLLGTHGRELMTYQYDMRTRAYYLARTLELNYPVFSISVLNLTGDAIKEITILLTGGVLVMQAAVKDVVELCRRRLDSILSLMSK